MMNTQASQARRQVATAFCVVAPGQFLRLPGSGQLDVVAGRVWLTRSGDSADHIVAGGQSETIAAGGNTLVGPWDRERSAIVAWHPRRPGEAGLDRARRVLSRCFEIVDPLRRIVAGVLAALIALLLGSVVFGPLSDARVRTLAGEAVLHNGAAATTDGIASGQGQRPRASAAPRERARIAAQEARRRPAGPA